MTSRRRQKRLPRKLRIQRVYRTIYRRTEKNKGATVAQLSGWHHVSRGTIRRDLRSIQRRGRKQGIRIKTQRIKGKSFFFYENIVLKEQQLLRQPTTGAWKLLAETKYSQGRGRGIQIQMMILIPDRTRTEITKGIERMKEALADHNFAGLADEMDFGTVPADRESRSFFRYKHIGEANWTVVW